MSRMPLRAAGDVMRRSVTSHRYRLVVDSETVNPLDLFDKPLTLIPVEPPTGPLHSSTQALIHGGRLGQ
jgi:hypothetical protein